MIPLFFLSIALNPYRNITIAVGAISTDRNPFWSQKLPGINSCDDDDYKFVYDYNHNERKTIIPFPNTLNNDTSSFELTQCNQQIKKKMIDTFNKLAIQGAFIRFYIGQTIIRTNFFTSSNNNKELFTHYLIYVDNTENTESPRAKVIPSEEASLIEKQEITIKFSLKFSKIDPDETRQKLNKEKSNQLNFLITVAVFMVVISLIISIAFYYKKKESHDIPLSEIWRIPPDLPNTFLFIIFGMDIISIFIYIILLKRDCDPYGSYIEKIVYPSILVPITVFTLIAKTIGLKPEIQNWMSPSIVYFFVFVLVPHIYTLFYNIFGSFRGFSPFFILFNDSFFLIMNLIFVNGVGPSAALLNPPRSVNAQTGPSPLQKKNVKFISRIIDFVYVCLSAVLLMPITSHLFEIFFDDELVNLKLFGTILFLFSSVASVFGLIRALPRTLYVTESWQSGIAPLNFILAFIEMFYVAYIALFERNIMNFQAILMVPVFALPLFFSIIGVGTVMLYLTPFIPILATFSQQKST